MQQDGDLRLGDVRPDESGCERVMGVEDEFEDLERAPASVRAGFLGKRDSSMRTGGEQTEQQERYLTSEYEVDCCDDHKEELRVWVAKPVVEPTTEERRTHRLKHCPYSSWCVECVSGPANLDPHRARGETLRNITELHVDYALLPLSEKRRG